MHQIFVPFNTIIQAQLNAGIQRTVANSLNAVAAPFTTALMIFIIVQGVGIMGTPWGRYDVWTGFRNMFTAGVVASLLTAQYYTDFVETPFLTTIPNWIAGVVNGAAGAQAGAQQFDAIWSSCSHIQAAILLKSSPIWSLDVRIEAGIYIGFIAIALLIAYVVWTLAGFVMAMMICVGPFVLPGLLFERTRQYTMSWLDTIVGVLLLMLMTSILLSFFVGGISQYIREAAAFPATTIDDQLNSLLEIAVFIFMCTCLAIALPFFASHISRGAGISLSRIPGMRG